jgi:putative ABC transport system permease protein
MALSPADLLLTTFRDLGGNWVRSGLTTLGIFMGVAAVNATLNIEAITTAQIQQKLAERDNPYLVAWMYNEAERKIGELQEEDVLALQREVPGVAGVSQTTPVGYGSSVRFQDAESDRVDLQGVSLNILETTGRRVVAGRFFQQSDFDQYYPVAVIDTVLQEQLFADVSPINQGIYVGNVRLTVVGVMETKKFWSEQDPEGEIWLTESYAGALANRWSRTTPQIAIRDLSNYEAVEQQVQEYLEQNYPAYRVSVWGNAKDLYKEEQQQRTSTRILKVVGLLALVIGGVGIANITIAAVMERTREIGLRRAIGATDWEVMMQFIVEAALLSLIGGTLAIATIHGLTKVATTRVFEAPYTFRPQAAVVSMGAAFVVGVGASFFPALRITQIDVVQALRGE